LENIFIQDYTPLAYSQHPLTSLQMKTWALANSDSSKGPSQFWSSCRISKAFLVTASKPNSSQDPIVLPSLPKGKTYYPICETWCKIKMQDVVHKLLRIPKWWQIALDHVQGPSKCEILTNCQAVCPEASLAPRCWPWEHSTMSDQHANLCLGDCFP
jgi:hypothetical protein